MKTLKTLIEQEWEKVVGISYGTDLKGRHYVDLQDLRPVFDSILETIVKESFKNTRVEEKKCDCRSCAGEDGEDCGDYMYDQALLNKHKKECEFLGK